VLPSVSAVLYCILHACSAVSSPSLCSSQRTPSDHGSQGATDMLYYVCEHVYRVFPLVHVLGNVTDCFAWQQAAQHVSLFKFVQCRLHIVLQCITVNTLNLLSTSKEGDGRLQLLLDLYTPHAMTVLEIVFVCSQKHATCNEGAVRCLLKFCWRKLEHCCLNACFTAGFVAVMKRVKNVVSCCCVMLRKGRMLSCHNWMNSCSQNGIRKCIIYQCEFMASEKRKWTLQS
jgi:hypothetical protein